MGVFVRCSREIGGGQRIVWKGVGEFAERGRGKAADFWRLAFQKIHQLHYAVCGAEIAEFQCARPLFLPDSDTWAMRGHQAQPSSVDSTRCAPSARREMARRHILALSTFTMVTHQSIVSRERMLCASRNDSQELGRMSEK